MGRAGNGTAEASTTQSQDGQGEIGLTIQGTDAVITIADDGPGIPVEARASIFERFHPPGTGPCILGELRGIGPGLAIAREIAVMHHGTIRVSNRLDGRPGAVFSVHLPLPETASDRSGREGRRLGRGKQQRHPGLGGAAPDQQ